MVFKPRLLSPIAEPDWSDSIPNCCSQENMAKFPHQGSPKEFPFKRGRTGSCSACFSSLLVKRWRCAWCTTSVRLSPDKTLAKFPLKSLLKLASIEGHLCLSLTSSFGENLKEVSLVKTLYLNFWSNSLSPSPYLITVACAFSIICAIYKFTREELSPMYHETFC